MIHSVPGGGAAPPCFPMFTRQQLQLRIVRRRARLAELETEMIAACEAAAWGACPIPGRDRWNRTARRRYLAAAMRLEATYGPPMRRLRDEIGQLERLMTLPLAA